LFKAKVLIKRRPSILDPQGKAAEQGAKLLGMNNINHTRIDKYVEFLVDTDDEAAAKAEISDYCGKLLSNPNLEDYEFTMERG
jgi:phosphoribosylformylglycinamidine synthase, purS protein